MKAGINSRSSKTVEADQLTLVNKCLYMHYAEMNEFTKCTLKSY